MAFVAFSGSCQILFDNLINYQLFVFQYNNYMSFGDGFLGGKKIFHLQDWWVGQGRRSLGQKHGISRILRSS